MSESTVAFIKKYRLRQNVNHLKFGGAEETASPLSLIPHKRALITGFRIGSTH